MDNNTEGDNSKRYRLSRRDFLKFSGLAGAGIATRRVDRILNSFFPSEGKLVEPVMPGFKKIEFPTLPFRRESMLVKGSDRPLSGEEIEKYFSEQNPENKPPYNVLTSEIIVGSEAWGRWNHGQSRSYLNQDPPANGKHILHYLKEHFVTIPQMVIDRTRPDACLRHIRMESPKHPTRVIIVDEDWLRENSQYGYGNMTTNVHSSSVHARYNFPASYEPSGSAYYQPRRGLDRGLMHEVSHQSMGLMPHYHNYFLTLGNWRTNIILPQGVTHDQMSLWRAREMKPDYLKHLY